MVVDRRAGYAPNVRHNAALAKEARMSRLGESEELARLWAFKPDLIRCYVSDADRHEQVCLEASYILRKRLEEADIPVSAVTSRVKSLNSVAEKVFRKSYTSIEHITDLAGVRVVHLYASDLPRIESIIDREFDVVERVDKLAPRKPSEFGYLATHYIVRLLKRSSGARFEDLKDLCCEIQVRTILQDAWAIIDHHLVYKTEEQVPATLRRKLNSLAGLFETADDQFDRVREERLRYIKGLEDSTEKSAHLLNQGINLDSATALLRKKFPDKPLSLTENHLAIVLRDIDTVRYQAIRDFEDVLRRTENARAALHKRNKTSNSAATELAYAIALDDRSYRREGWDDFALIELFEELEHMVLPCQG